MLKLSNATIKSNLLYHVIGRLYTLNMLNRFLKRNQLLMYADIKLRIVRMLNNRCYLQ